MTHGDHSPRHGGTVYMYGDVHYEVVLHREGRHRVYFSDAAREELPAATASGVSLTIRRPHVAVETLTASIDEHGESWIARGAPVGEEEATVRVEFVMAGEPYWIDVPFVAAAP